MMTNENAVDRLIRLIAGVALLAMIPNIGPIGWIGIVPILTGAFGFCPLYRLVGFSTCRTQRK